LATNATGHEGGIDLHDLTVLQAAEIIGGAIFQLELRVGIGLNQEIAGKRVQGELGA
jgi:hypothetical protein